MHTHAHTVSLVLRKSDEEDLEALKDRSSSVLFNIDYRFLIASATEKAFGMGLRNDTCL